MWGGVRESAAKGGEQEGRSWAALTHPSSSLALLLLLAVALAVLLNALKPSGLGRLSKEVD